MAARGSGVFSGSEKLGEEAAPRGEDDGGGGSPRGRRWRRLGRREDGGGELTVVGGPGTTVHKKGKEARHGVRKEER